MNPDLENSIIEKYPSLFANIGQRGSPMKFGLAAVGDGWAGIVSTMCWIINQKDTAKTFRFDQIKEKFGLLRVYHSGGSEYMAGVVRMAEDISGSICEVCGQPGEQRKGGWIKTLCDRCHSPITTAREIEVQRACTSAARDEIERLREAIRRLADQDADLSVQAGNVTVTMDYTLTDEERDAVKYFSEWCIGPSKRLKRYKDALRGLLERTK
jgi:hypothetical protein